MSYNNNDNNVSAKKEVLYPSRALYILKICQSVSLLTGDIQTYRETIFKVKNGNKDEWHVRLLYS